MREEERRKERGVRKEENEKDKDRRVRGATGEEEDGKKGEEEVEE